MRTIRLPSGKQVSLGVYVEAWRIALKTEPSKEVSDWQWFPVTIADVLRDLSYGVHDRINQHLPQKEDKRGAITRLWNRLKSGRIQRECKGCGQPFKPANVSRYHCCYECRY